MTVEKACGYIREALEEMGYRVRFSGRFVGWTASWDRTPPALQFSVLGALLNALDSLDPMGTTYKEEG